MRLRCARVPAPAATERLRRGPLRGRRGASVLAAAIGLTAAPAPPGGAFPLPPRALRFAADTTARITAPAPASYGWRQLLRDREELTLDARSRRGLLRHAFLAFGSEVVREGSRVLERNVDYGIDYNRGVVFLLRDAEDARRLEVEYLYLPAPRQRVFHAARIDALDDLLARQPAAPAGAPGPGVAARDATGPELRLPSGLQLSGSKTIGVALGRNREASLEQSLRVQVSGELGDDLHVNAVLSDDNLPVLPEGNTEELGDLNKVFIEVRGPVVGGIVGDFDLRRDRGEFVRFERELRGGQASVRLPGGQVVAAAGLAKGELLTATFRGEEGKQGPYELLPARRLNFSTILPGSERVLLDGERLRRGESRDYVIDYDRGELRFTSRRRITAYSEIAVDFEVSTERYRRDTRAVHWEQQRGTWALRGMVFQEGDDRDRPIGNDLTPEEITILQAAGDSAAVTAGIRHVAAGRGTYRFDAADSSVVVYDPGRGDLEVTFREVGAGRGDYDDDLDPTTGRRFFRHVGAGNGAFAIGRVLPLPERLRVVSGRLEGAPWPGATLVGEVSLSDRDRNVFSQRDDADNRGTAFDVRLDTGEAHLVPHTGIGVAVHASRLSERFRSPGRGRPGFYYKDWNAEQDSLAARELLAETLVRARWGAPSSPWGRVTTRVGRLDRGPQLQTDRTEVDVSLGPRADRGVFARWQRLDTERRVDTVDGGRSRRFVRGGGRWRWGWMLPEVVFERDVFRRAELDSTLRPSYRYRDVRGRVQLGRGPRGQLQLEVSRRDTDRAPDPGGAPGAASWVPDRRNDALGVTWLGRPVPGWNTELAWSRRTNEPREGSQARTVSNLGRGVLGWRPAGRAVRSEVRYEVSEEAVRRLQQVLVRSPDGRGDFDAEGRPVGKDQGEYDKVFRFLGETEAVRELSASWRLELGGRGGSSRPDSGGAWWRRNLALVQVLSVQEQTREGRRALYFLVPGAFQNAGTVFGSFRARQEWSFLAGVRRHSLRLQLQWEDDLDARFGGERIDAQRGQALLRYENSGMRAWTWGGDAAWALRRRGGPLSARPIGRPSSEVHDVRSVRARGRAAYRLSANERLTLELGGSRQRDRRSGTVQHLLEVEPAATWAPTRNLRLFSTVLVTRVFEDKPEDVLPPFFFDPPGTRSRTSVTGSYRLGRSLHLNLTYTGLRSTDGRTNYDVKLETRALF